MNRYPVGDNDLKTAFSPTDSNEDLGYIPEPLLLEFDPSVNDPFGYEDDKQVEDNKQVEDDIENISFSHRLRGGIR